MPEGKNAVLVIEDADLENATGLRAELPAWAASLRIPAVAHESVGWALLSGIGAGLLVGGLVQIVLLVVYPILFAPTSEHPEWLTPFNVSRVASSVTSGIVLMRAGGVRALLAFLVYEVVLSLGAYGFQQRLCAGVSLGAACDLSTALIRNWPQWLAIVIGAAGSRSVTAESRPGANSLLRAAGVYSLVSTLISLVLNLTLTLGASTVDAQLTSTGLYTVGHLVAGALAGIVLARSPLAAAVLLAVIVAAPVLSYAIPQAIRSSPMAQNESIRLLIWSGTLTLAVAAASIVIARVLARRRLEAGEGTVS